MAFDPYHIWLGIPPEDHPPSHYRLLAIPELESNPDVIDAGAEQRTIYLRTFQTGDRALLAENLLNEVSAARYNGGLASSKMYWKCALCL